MPQVYFVTHPEVVIDPKVPVPQWPLSEIGIKRMNIFVAKEWVQNISAIYCSAEQKAIDGAEILANHLNLPFSTDEQLGENDRSATGYLQKEAFEAMANRFFENPNESVEGWERAVDAQYRIVIAVEDTIRNDKSSEHLAIVSHGGVGTLLLCHLSGSPISRSMDQPGGGGGNVFCFDKETKRLIHGWKSIEDS